jgi:hypothetical protein
MATYAEEQAERIRAANAGEALRPQISTDAQFIASKIVRHMWIIFVLLPVMLAILFAFLKS